MGGVRELGDREHIRCRKPEAAMLAGRPREAAAHMLSLHAPDGVNSPFGTLHLHPTANNDPHRYVANLHAIGSFLLNQAGEGDIEENSAKLIEALKAAHTSPPVFKALLRRVGAETVVML